MELDPTRLKIMQFIQDSGTDLKNASMAIGRNAAYLHQYLHRGTPRVLPEDVRDLLGPLLGVAPDELRHPNPHPGRVAVAPPRHFPGERPSSAPAPNQIRDYPRGSASRYERGEGSIGITGQGEARGSAAVHEMDVSVSAGPGAYHDGPEGERALWMFPEAVVRHEFRARPEDLRIITVEGDSMEPLLGSGDRIVVDTSRSLPVPPGVFVIWDGMGLVAKRVEHIPHSKPTKLAIRSINPDYPAYERLAEEVRIIGRVVWVTKRL